MTITKGKPVYIPAWMRLLPLLKKYNISRASIITGVTYSHVHNIIQELQAKKLILVEKQGRANVIIFTTLGDTICEACEKLIKFIK